MSGDAQLGKRVGITMALLGVLLAVCGALVDSERTNLVRTLVAQANAWDEYQSESMKNRMMTSELVMLVALTPTKLEAEAFDASMAKIRAGAGKGDNPEVMEAVDVASRELADVLSPDHEDGLHFVTLIGRYSREQSAAARWASAFDLGVNAHFTSSARFEKAQLVAEIGIVIASVALLFSSRPLWFAALLALAGGTAAVGVTFLTSRRAIVASEETVARLEREYRDLRTKLDARGEDDALVRRIVAGEDTAAFGPR